MNSNKNCIACLTSLANAPKLHFDKMYVCNRIESEILNGAEKISITLTTCEYCHLIQLSEFPDEEQIVPRVPWIRYNEPSAHLQTLASEIISLLDKGEFTMIGVCPFDEPFISILGKNGFVEKDLNLRKYFPQSDTNFPYLETYQSFLRTNKLIEISVGEVVDLVSCRYLIEHSYEPIDSLKALGSLLKTNGLLLIEIPDSSKFLSACDYSFIWEEHISYFTEESFSNFAKLAGYEIVRCKRYPGLLEDALAFILRKKENVLPVKEHFSATSDLFTKYTDSFLGLKKKYSETLKSLISDGGRVIIFGAGHQSITFINCFELSGYISYVVDDDPNKINCFIPGTQIKIKNSDFFLNDLSITDCVFGINPALEEKIKIKLSSFLDRGGRIYSIFQGGLTHTLVSDFN